MPNGNKWHFPAILFGEFRNCRKLWQELLQSAWKSGSWESALDAEHHIDIRNDEADIVYEIGRGPIDLQISTPQWWLAYVGDLRPTKSKSIKQLEQDQALFLDGLKFLWFVIGCLGKHTNLPYLRNTEMYFKNRNKLLSAVADAAITWIPEIIELSPRLAEGAYLPKWRNVHSIPPWIIAIRQTLGMGGYDICTWPTGRDMWVELLGQHHGDPIRFLEMTQVIASNANRYVIGPAVVKAPGSDEI